MTPLDWVVMAIVAIAAIAVPVILKMPHKNKRQAQRHNKQTRPLFELVGFLLPKACQFVDAN